MSYTYEITTAGKALIAKAQNGTIINLTKAKLGKGDLLPEDPPADFTGLIDPVSTNVKIQQKEYIEGSGQAKITLTYTNETLTEGFSVKEIGLFSNDPDVGEILFLYCYSSDADYLPASSSVTVEQVVNLIVAVNNAENVTAQITPETNVIRDNISANSILKADQDNEPEALTVSENRIVGRKTGGVIDDLTPNEVREIQNTATNDALFKSNLNVEGDLQLNKYTSGFLSSDSSGNITSQAGFVMPWPTSLVPSGFLSCNGASVSRTTYAELFAVIGTEYGSLDSENFNLPDYRGEFLRGWNDGSGSDPDANDRDPRGDGVTGDNIGTQQDDTFQGHWHDVRREKQNNHIVDYNGSYSGTGVSGEFGSRDRAIAKEAITDGLNGTPRTSSETRPRNIYVQFIIKT
ncbi:MAG: hypothetical protein GY714_04855 [Desulfobacterales bacterium]|nr:hypothetical protein [Desulfobacterales bacterium]